MGGKREEVALERDLLDCLERLREILVRDEAGILLCACGVMGLGLGMVCCSGLRVGHDLKMFSLACCCFALGILKKAVENWREEKGKRASFRGSDGLTLSVSSLTSR